MTTKIHLAVGTAHAECTEWRALCHVGCTTWQPGAKGCKVWTREELFRRCEAEVAGMHAATRAQKIARMYAYRDSYTLKTPTRFEFIHSVEWFAGNTGRSQ